MRRYVILAAALAAVLPGTGLALPTTALAFASCAPGYYENARGRCVRRPVRAERPPQGATAQCRDGTYSFSQSRRGTCSHHGGVRRWL